MSLKTVLIVEDDCLIAFDVQQELTAAGFFVCGVASSQAEALEMAAALWPDLAVVDIGLDPGDGRIVAKRLHDELGAAVLFATGQCSEIERLHGTGAMGCLPKPYSAALVPAALRAVCRMADGDTPAELPDSMVALAA